MSNNNVSSPTLDNPQLWVVTEGMAGTENQCLAVSHALEIQPVVKRIGLTQPWKFLSPYLGFEVPETFTGDALAPPFPHIIIAAGRKAIAACRYIKQQSPNTFIVFLQNPRAAYKIFDLIAAPAHDTLTGNNVISTIATPTKFNPDYIKNIQQKNSSPFLHPNKIKIGFLIGGGIAGRAMPACEQNKILETIKNLQTQTGYELFIIGSRRTPLSLSNDLKTIAPSSWFMGDTRPNPYEPVIAYSDIVIVTSDSPSMLSDAASAGKASYSLGAPKTTRHKALINTLTNHGFIKEYKGNCEPFIPPVLNDAALIAAEIRRKTGL